MSYDIFFWREQPGVNIDAERLLNDLADTVEFPGLIALPLDTAKQAFRQEFTDIIDGGSSLDWEGDGSYFQVSFIFLDEHTISLTAINCGYELLKSPAAMRRLSNVGSSLGCRIYDPQQA